MNQRRHKLSHPRLALALAVALGCMASGSALAQATTGAVAGRAAPGAQVTVTNKDTGYTRTVTAGADGVYRVNQLPVGNYSVANAAGGQESYTATVQLGSTTTVNFADASAPSGAAADELGRVVVRGGVVNRVDVRSTESATNVDRQDIARLPVPQSLASVAFLAPGVNAGTSSFGGITFGGSSVAENSVFINGLNVTDFYRRQSFSAAPFAFFQQFQVKTGGYSVEFGRSTGGVINAVTRRGGNEWHGGVEATVVPKQWRSRARDQSGAIPIFASHDTDSFAKANVWVSGPIAKDRLFGFVMYERQYDDNRYTTSLGTSYNRGKMNSGFWGAKIDWRITQNHLLELLAFSDAATTNTNSYRYDFASGKQGGMTGQRSVDTGGRNGSLTYTGYFGENFVAKAMMGVNRSQSMALSPADAGCALVSINSASYGAAWRALGSPTLGCHPGGSMVQHQDERRVGRLDFEWTLGSHQLRFGLDREVMKTDRTSFYPGGGVSYTVYGAQPGATINDIGGMMPAGATAYVVGRRRADGGVFETTANAWYIEDNWNITPNFLLNLGVRVDEFNNKTAQGASFIHMKNLVSPRLGFSWDLSGDGRTKLFGNLGRYYLPVTNNINYTFAGGLTDEYAYSVLQGWQTQNNQYSGSPYVTPILGQQIGPVDTRMNVSAADLRKSVDRDLKAVYQDELILGFQHAIDSKWSFGVNATKRRMHGALDDIRINHTPCGNTSTLWPIGNPGEPLTIWGTKSMGCASDGWITIDLSKDGYVKGGSGQVIGYSKPKRGYTSLEFQLDRAWDAKWSFNASYMWSRLTGNHEGPVNSDTNYADTGMVQHFDHPANNDRYGVLFNDHTHQFKFRGAYAFNDNLSVGATFRALSGGPITAYGVTWPGDTLGAGSFTSYTSGGGSGWLCVPDAASCTDWRTRQYVRTERGAFGRMPWTYDMGANVTWTMPMGTSQFKATFSVYNLLNEQKVVNVVQRYESGPGTKRAEFMVPTRFQSPRYAQLLLGWSF